VGDVAALQEHFTRLHGDPAQLAELRGGCLRMAPEVTWAEAGATLLDVYREVVQAEAIRPAVVAAAR